MGFAALAKLVCDWIHTSTNRLYAVETQPDMSTEPWQAVAPTSPGSGTETIVPDTAAGPHRF